MSELIIVLIFQAKMIEDLEGQRNKLNKEMKMIEEGGTGLPEEVRVINL